jgi:hypothetical protein
VLTCVGASVALLVGCADPGPTLEDTGFPTPTVDPIEDLADGMTGTTVATENGCQAAPIPEGVDTGITASVSLDESTDGVIRVHRNDAGRWRIRIEAADGDSIEAPLQVDLATDPDTGAIRPLGATDLDGDGPTELFTVVGDAPGAALVTIHVQVDCALAPVTVGGGSLSFPVGARPMLTSGLACTDHDGDGRVDGVTGWIGLPDGEGTDGSAQWRVDGVVYALTGTELMQVETVSEAGLTEAEAAAYGMLDCPGLPRLDT